MRKYRKFQDVLIDELRDDPEQAFAYLQVALEEFDQDGDVEHLMLAVRNVAEAQGGVPELARQINIGKTSPAFTRPFPRRETPPSARLEPFCTGLATGWL